MGDDTTLPAIVGELIEIPEAGYQFGTGILVLRVGKVTAAPDPGWIIITGVQIGWDGRRIGERSVVARRAAVTLVRHPA
jgi:hypothetical protein